MSLPSDIHIAQIVYDIALDKSFDYLIPSHLQDDVQKGSIVKAPFGERTLIGVVVEVTNKTSLKPSQLKEIGEVLPERLFIETHLFELALWMSKYYVCPLGRVFRAIYPNYLRKTRRNKETLLVSLAQNREEIIRYTDSLGTRAKRQAAVLRYMIAQKNVYTDMTAVTEATESDKSVIERLVEKKFLELHTEDDIMEKEGRQRRYTYVEPVETLQLNEHQASALSDIVQAIESDSFAPIVLHGVTGSGKTEVYLRSIKEVLRNGKQAIMLIPEISLTPQTEERFRKRFGNQVAVFHSRLSDGARADEWNRMRTAQVQLVVGARSAIFAPFEHLGLIIVDEEHERSYKQEESPRYHARDIAVLRAKMAGIPVILGSATPSIESFYNIQSGKYRLLELPARVDDRSMPDVRVVDLTEEVREEKKWIVLSSLLKAKIRDRLQKGEQIILFINRRGFSSMAVCQQCGYVYECDECSITLTYHRSIEKLMCHFCGKMEPKAVFCKKCRSSEIKYTGMGTQRVERALKAVFPEARILRMDSDTTAHKNAHFELLGQFRRGKADILIGTQMIAKGLDFPRVTLVGTIIAESTLCLPDFRAAEVTFQLLTQVAGRAGRGEIPGEVVLQTFMKDHPAVVCAIKHDYYGFIEEELKARRSLSYPPYCRFINIIISAKDKKKGHWLAMQLAGKLQKSVPTGCDIKGPLPSVVHRKKGYYFWHILIKTNQVFAVNECINTAMQKSNKFSGAKVVVDVDPYFMW